jgi:hypothetical protein
MSDEASQEPPLTPADNLKGSNAEVGFELVFSGLH